MTDLSSLVPSIVAGIASGLTTLAILPMLFKGKLRHEREILEKEKTHKAALDALIHETNERIRLKNERHIEVVQIKDDEIERLQDTLETSQRESKDKDGLIIELTKQVLNAINVLNSIGGLAAKERRSPRGTS